MDEERKPDAPAPDSGETPLTGTSRAAAGEELVVHEPGSDTVDERALEQIFDTMPGATAEELAPVVNELAPPDAADTLEQLEPEQSAEVLTQMEEESAADALAHMDPVLAATVLMDLEPAEAAGLVNEMEPDDAADLLQALPKDAAAAILRAVPPRRAALLGKLALYDPRSAGGLMTTDIQVVRASMTIGQAIEFIRTHPMEEHQTDVYVVDDDRRLVGTIGLRQLLFADDGAPVASFVSRDLDAVLPTVDREEVAELFSKYDYITMPVVDEQRRILGMVTVDDVIDILNARRAEDALKLVGVQAGEAAYAGVATKLRSRSPWLLMNLITAQIASAVLLLYHDFIELIPVVAVIYPVIANESGNTGQQSLAVTLRGLVLGQVRRDFVWKMLLREVGAGAVAGLAVGVCFSVSIWMIDATGLIDDMTWKIGVIAGLAMMGSMTIACLVGTAIPLILDRLGFDPATASSIFLTMLTDSLSYTVFLTLAFLMRGWLGVGGG
ncbi:MAG: magnesium transporter [Planctomycetota bacterium]|nr:magnesium transporter [Planctomycetota bacterium]